MTTTKSKQFKVLDAGEVECLSCGRHFDPADVCEDPTKCLSEDCPSYWEEKGIAHPEFPESAPIQA